MPETTTDLSATATTTAGTAKDLDASLAQFKEKFEALRNEVANVIVGQREILDFTLIAMIAGGHVLLEGVPGLGKTMLVRSLASALHLRFQRIQFTPDLMPADVIGTNILVDEGHGHSKFQFSQGPLFCNLLLADEINRATPKTQSALLEAMQEKSVTVAGETRILERPFFVLATQNPLEMEGTYPLPEAQLDRFFFKLRVPYPSKAEFGEILLRTTERKSPTVNPIFDGKDLVALGEFARDVPMAPSIRERVVDLIMSTHPEVTHASADVRKYVRYGASPRAGQACVLAAKIHAVLARRAHVSMEDVYAVALPVLRHRVMLNFEAQADGMDTDKLISKIIETEGKNWAKAA
ncbi:MAG: AAA family ATPase [Candidatus Methylacidiphilales bacterium]|nr:MoxR family ATPase [Candidatus Methylacidiphilales bacterium]